MWLFVKCMNLLLIASQVTQWLKNPPAIAGDAGDTGLTPGSGRSPGVGDGNPLKYSCLEDLMDRALMAGYSPQGCKESVTTEATEHAARIIFKNI